MHQIWPVPLLPSALRKLNIRKSRFLGGPDNRETHLTRASNSPGAFPPRIFSGVFLPRKGFSDIQTTTLQHPTRASNSPSAFPSLGITHTSHQEKLFRAGPGNCKRMFQRPLTRASILPGPFPPRNVWRGATRAEDAQGIPTQSHILTSMRVYEGKRLFDAPEIHLT